VSAPVQTASVGTVLDYQLTLAQLGRGADYLVYSEGMNDNLDKFHFESSPKEASTQDNETELSRLKSSFSFLSSLIGKGKDTTGVQEFQSELTEFRIYQEISVGRNSPIRQANLTRLEYQVSSDGGNLVSVLHTRYTSDRSFDRRLIARCEGRLAAIIRR
jgi:hypothetical protein